MFATVYVTVYDEILVPTDGSGASVAAVEHAISIAKPHDATVHFLHVIDVGTEMSASGLGTIAPELSKSLEQRGNDALDDAVERAESEGVQFERTILEGTPQEAITDYSSDHAVDLIVMGRSGRSGLKERIIGSSTDRVIRSGEAPVLVAHEEGEEAEDSE
ncbi:Nucleotide-binding universal stress protein, UspA family [Halostagnicola kamekurae]|uniref:Nucleotide-binding universal stress protein, UspA family n=1 Tax=Halostagnicola kamekurae TaxID=619731 RepID=A0A1I6TJ18_9EURY|nr:Nucleotide-binding universal stress protein, UspA family [Halostagnicola kamekurae]